MFSWLYAFKQPCTLRKELFRGSLDGEWLCRSYRVVYTSAGKRTANYKIHVLRMDPCPIISAQLWSYGGPSLSDTVDGAKPKPF